MRDPRAASLLANAALEACVPVARRLGVSTADLKPCVAYYLDGGETYAERHKTAFVLALELRSLGLTVQETTKWIDWWARKAKQRPRETFSAVRAAYRERPSGGWWYHAPGLVKKPNTAAAHVLLDICEAVGCPAHCPAFSAKYQGVLNADFKQFARLGWVRHLKRRRRTSDVDVYRALCRRERELGLGPGVELLTSYKQLAEMAERHYTTIGKALRQLAADGLLSVEFGGGSGPHAHDRTPTRVRRVVPIPGKGKGSPNPAITTGSRSQPQIGRRPMPSSERTDG